jgi:hypothetical protein
MMQDEEELEDEWKDAPEEDQQEIEEKDRT